MPGMEFIVHGGGDGYGSATPAPAPSVPPGYGPAPTPGTATATAPPRTELPVTGDAGPDTALVGLAFLVLGAALVALSRPYRYPARHRMLVNTA